MNSFYQHLNAPEYRHVLLNSLPVYGLAFGALALLLALPLRNQRVTIAALVLVFLGAISAWPVYEYGQSGYDRVKAMADADGDKWLDEHMARAEKLIWMFFVLAAVSVVRVVVTMKWSRHSAAISVITLLIASGTLGVGEYIAYACGHIRHKEFRFEPPPPPRAEEHHHGEQHHEHEP